MVQNGFGGTWTTEWHYSKSSNYDLPENQALKENLHPQFVSQKLSMKFYFTLKKYFKLINNNTCQGPVRTTCKELVGSRPSKSWADLLHQYYNEMICFSFSVFWAFVALARAQYKKI